MAQPIEFTPKPVDPRLELQRRLAAEHAEALLAAFDLLEEAHRQGVLDALRGAVGAKDTIVGILAQYSAEPVSVNALRHLLALGKMLGSLDPQPISKLSADLVRTINAHRAQSQPPSLWQLFKRMRDPDARRGLSFLTSMLAALGRSVR